MSSLNTRLELAWRLEFHWILVLVMKLGVPWTLELHELGHGKN